MLTPRLNPRPEDHALGVCEMRYLIQIALLLNINCLAATPDTRLANEYGRLPLSFEINTGQTDAQARFLARGPGYSVFLTDRGPVLSMRQGALRLLFPGSSQQPGLQGIEPLQGRSNYFIGADPAKLSPDPPLIGPRTCAREGHGEQGPPFAHRGRVERSGVGCTSTCVGLGMLRVAPDKGIRARRGILT